MKNNNNYKNITDDEIIKLLFENIPEEYQNRKFGMLFRSARKAFNYKFSNLPFDTIKQRCIIIYNYIQYKEKLKILDYIKIQREKKFMESINKKDISFPRVLSNARKYGFNSGYGFENNCKDIINFYKNSENNYINKSKNEEIVLNKEKEFLKSINKENYTFASLLRVARNAGYKKYQNSNKFEDKIKDILSYINKEKLENDEIKFLNFININGSFYAQLREARNKGFKRSLKENSFKMKCKDIYSLKRYRIRQENLYKQNIKNNIINNKNYMISLGMSNIDFYAFLRRAHQEGFNTGNYYNDIYIYKKYLLYKNFINILKEKAKKQEINEFFKENGKDNKDFRLEMSHAGLCGFKEKDYKIKLTKYWKFIAIKQLLNIFNKYIPVLAMIENNKSPFSFYNWISACNYNDRFNIIINNDDSLETKLIKLKLYWNFIKEEKILYKENHMDERKISAIWIKNYPNQFNFIKENTINFNNIYNNINIKLFYVYCWLIDGIPYYIGESGEIIFRLYHHMYEIYNSPEYWVYIKNNFNNHKLSVIILDKKYTKKDIVKSQLRFIKILKPLSQKCNGTDHIIKLENRNFNLFNIKDKWYTKKFNKLLLEENYGKQRRN